MSNDEPFPHRQRHTIGVFDSGFGGLTVLRELLPAISGAHYIYLGDTARLPYGAKSRVTVARYAVSSARFLQERGATVLVVACNTATALALEEIRAAVDIPVVGVVEPGARAAFAMVSNSKDVLILATSATVQSHAYRDACALLQLRATEIACPLLVPLIEEGWIDHHVTREVLRIYLEGALQLCSPSALLLGCTHYPLIKQQIGAVLRELGCDAPLVDSALAVARQVALSLNSFAQTEAWVPATFQCFATDSTDKFQRLGGQFLGQPIDRVELIDLGE